MLEFSPQEKEEAFDLLSSMFYQQNFATLGKTDFDLLMFHLYLNHVINNGLPEDDYTISKDLGITQQRVRSLKIRDHLRYGQKEKWENILGRTALQHPHYSDDDRYIILSFDNPSVMIETQHFIEANGGFVDFSFNPKLLKMKVTDFTKLIIEIGLSKNEKEVIKRLQALYREETGKDQIITKDTLWNQIKDGSLETCKVVIQTIIAAVISKELHC